MHIVRVDMILPRHSDNTGATAATVRAAQECRRHFLSSEVVSDVKPSSVMLDNKPSDSDLEERKSPFVTTEQSTEEKDLDALLEKFERTGSLDTFDDDLEEHVPRKSDYKPRKFVLEGVPHTTQPLILRQLLSEAFGSPVAISGTHCFVQNTAQHVPFLFFFLRVGNRLSKQKKLSNFSAPWGVWGDSVRLLLQSVSWAVFFLDGETGATSTICLSRAQKYSTRTRGVVWEYIDNYCPSRQRNFV